MVTRGMCDGGGRVGSSGGGCVMPERQQWPREVRVTVASARGSNAWAVVARGTTGCELCVCRFNKEMAARSNDEGIPRCMDPPSARRGCGRRASEDYFISITIYAQNYCFNAQTQSASTFTLCLTLFLRYWLVVNQHLHCI